jgi:SAM-dependent methyltransferase
LLVITTTIITTVQDPTGLARDSADQTLDSAIPADDQAWLERFYDDAYTQDAERAALFSRWRALGAVGKAEHVIRLCTDAGLWADGHPSTTLEVGCGDGALLCELHARGFGGALSGVEITQAAVDIARTRGQLQSVELYDGLRLPAADGAYELGVLSHVLEHVPDPAALLSEVARACVAVVMEVPLEANVSARRSAKREHAAEVGHLQRLDRSSARAIATRAGLDIVAELEDPLPLEVHRFFAKDARGRATGTARWALRSGLHRVAPGLARRVFTVHYACLLVPRGACVARAQPSG